MTAKKDLKKRVRDRQARTGEAYTVALRHVQAQRPGTPIPVVELIDLTAVGAAAGLACRISMYPGLAGRIDPAAALTRLREALMDTPDDSALEHMRAVALRGENPEVPFASDFGPAGRRFIARARAGIGGVSDAGRMLALTIDGTAGAITLLFILWLAPVLAGPRYGMIIVTTPDGLTADPLLGWKEEP
jgi:hypothetical protein